jgi:hypothetical protein
MTTATLRDERRGNGWGAILAGWLIAAIAIGYQVGGVNVTPRPHAVQRHGEAVYGARSAFGQQDPRQRRSECPKSDRVIHMAPLNDGTGMWGVMIEGMTSHLELTCWVVGAQDVERTWTRLLQMHECEPDAATRAAGHDHWAGEVH